MASDLADKKCVPCSGGVPALNATEIEPLLQRIEGWSVTDHKKLEKTYPFDDFMGPVRFLNAVAEVAESEGHHPDLLVRWGSVAATVFTHKVDGLTESDFILAAKMDRVFDGFK
jgi:4a-hydroxytetrahydrobiopterin dehydratase